MGRFIDLTGQRFGRLTVQARVANTTKGHVQWTCLCDCGQRSLTTTTYLRTGDTTSCGCRQREIIDARLGIKAVVEKAGRRGAPTCQCPGVRKRKKDRLCNRHRTLWHKYHLTPEMHDLLLTEQEYLCALCKCSFELTQAVVDHSHATGQVRGLLCHLCNRGLGHFKDRPELLRAAITYLEMDRVSPLHARIDFGTNGTTKVKQRIYPKQSQS